jgi:hypothetical protein
MKGGTALIKETIRLVKHNKKQYIYSGTGQSHQSASPNSKNKGQMLTKILLAVKDDTEPLHN